MKGTFFNPLQEVQLSEHKRWCEKACDINEAMQKNGKPEDLHIGMSIVDYALNRLLEDVNYNPREQGYYWVRTGNCWNVEEWIAGEWVFDSYNSSDDGSFDEIDERRIVRKMSD